MADTFTDPRSTRRQFLANILAPQQIPGITNPIVAGLQQFGRGIGGALIGRGLIREEEEQQRQQAGQLADLLSPRPTPAQTQMALAAGGGPTRQAASILPGGESRADPTRQALAQLIRNNPGALSSLGPQALALALQPPAAAPRQVLQPGATLVDPRSGEQIAQAPFRPQRTFEQELQLRQAGRAQTTINTGPSGVQFPDPPRDFVYRRNPDGTVRVNDEGLPELVVLANTETAEKRRSAQQAQAARETQTRRFADVVTQDIDRVLTILDESAITGPFSLTQAVPGTPANDAARLIDTVRANVGFDRLQALRDASPTGGALGQVSEQENRLLQSTLGNLELSQSETQFRTNLQRLKRVYLDIIHGPGNRPSAPRPAVVTEGQQAAGQTPQRPEGPSLESLTPQDLEGLTDEQLRSLLQ